MVRIEAVIIRKLTGYIPVVIGYMIPGNNTAVSLGKIDKVPSDIKHIGTIGSVVYSKRRVGQRIPFITVYRVPMKLLIGA